MKVSTVCYITKDDSYVMLYRNKKPNDPNAGKWIGIGGKCEESESPKECVIREVKEELGVDILKPSLRGVITFISDTYETEYMYVYTASEFEGEVGECAEGTVELIKKSEIMNLSLWEGDRIFLKYLLEDRGFFNITLKYEGDSLASHEEEVYDEEWVRGEYRSLVKALIERGITIATMESITGGLIASLITDNSGSSEIFKGGAITYSNETKIKAGVPKEIIDIYSAYSEETAKAMTHASKIHYETEIGVGITGTAGNVDPADTAHSKPGEVYIAVAYGEDTIAQKLSLKYENVKRYDYKLNIAYELVKLIKKVIGE